jgi:hypothetical protein
MAEPTSEKQYPICPSCGSYKIHRSLRRGPHEWVLHRLLFQSPYRCEACDERFFGFRVARDQKKERHQVSAS